MTGSTDNAPVRWSVCGDGIGVITIDRPKRLNALNLEVKRLLESAVDEFTDASDIRVIVITGANGVFVAGTDLSEMVGMSAGDHSEMETGRVFSVLRDCSKPLIAAVEKYALGGGMELALACDLIVAGDDAKFAQPEINVGIMPGAGGTQLLLRTLGKYRAMKLVLSGERIDARQALEWGLVSEVVESGTALDSATRLAADIAAKPPLAVAAIKQVMRQGQDESLTDALVSEREAFTRLFDTDDQVEGMRAFLAKRTPTFRGR